MHRGGEGRRYVTSERDDDDDDGVERRLECLLPKLYEALRG